MSALAEGFFDYDDALLQEQGVCRVPEAGRSSAGTPPGPRCLISAHDSSTQMDLGCGRGRSTVDGGLFPFPGHRAAEIPPGLVQPTAQRVDRTPERHGNLGLLP